MPAIASSIVEICVFKFEEDRPWYLLLHRSEDEETYPGIWQIITGSVEKDEKAPEAALRELAEETGLLPRAFWVAPFVTSFYDAGWDAVNLCPVFAVQVEPGDIPRLSREHSEAGWFLLEEAVQKLPWPAQQEALRVVHQHIARGGRASGLTRIA